MSCKKIKINIYDTVIITIKYNKKNGYKIHHEFNKISQKSYYINGKVNGKTTNYYKNINIKSIYYDINGELVGDFIMYHNNGIKCKKVCTIDKEINGEMVEYHNNGNISYKYYLIEGLKNGYGFSYNQDGVLLCIAYHIDYSIVFITENKL